MEFNKIENDQNNWKHANLFALPFLTPPVVERSVTSKLASLRRSAQQWEPRRLDLNADVQIFSRYLERFGDIYEK